MATVERNQRTVIPHETLPQLRDRLGGMVASTVQGIAADTFRRMRECRNPDQLALLQGGIWYAGDYYAILSELAPQHALVAERLKFLRDRDRFYVLHPPRQKNPPLQLFNLVKSSSSLSGFEVVKIRLAEGVEPSYALDSLIIRREFALLECATVCQIGQYEALRQVLGEDKFNKLFSHASGSPLTLSDYNSKDNPLCSFLELVPQEEGKRGDRAVEIGQRVGFKNIDRYQQKHQLLGEAGAINAVPLNTKPGQQKYVGLGLSPEGMTEEEIEQLLVDEYNKPPLSSACLSDDLAKRMFKQGCAANLAYCKMVASPTEENARAVRQIMQSLGLPSTEIEAVIAGQTVLAQPYTIAEARKETFGFSRVNVVDFKVRLIQELVQMPLSQVSMDFVRAYGKTASVAAAAASAAAAR